jgi:hypothetical protein
VRNIIVRFAAAVGASLLLTDVSIATQVPADLRGIQHAVQRQQDYIEIQNLMSLRAYLHSAGRQDKEVELYAQRREDVSFGINEGYRVGLQNIRAAYVERFAQTRQVQLERMTQLFPQIKSAPENIGVGTFVVHNLTTPIIQVAEDGKTAKGMWYTPAALASVDSSGKFHGTWTWEKYAVDFVKEDSNWKFWHILVLTDFGVPMDKDLADGVLGAIQGAEGGPGATQSTTATKMPPPLPRQVDVQVYQKWGPTTVPKLFPPPEPYRTFSETFSYGPPPTRTPVTGRPGAQSSQPAESPRGAGPSGSGLVSSDIPPDAPRADQPATEDLVRAVKDSDLAPPSADPRDFNGVWFPDRTYKDGTREQPQYLPGREPPKLQLADNEAVASDSVLCLPSVRFTGAGGGMVDLYVQNERELVQFSEENADRRQILLGVEHPRQIVPSVVGHSVAHWEGNTLVVDTVALMDTTFLKSGAARKASPLHVVERIRKVRDGHYLEHQVTYEDPDKFVKPYTTTWGERWRPDMNIGEHVCEEGFDRFQIVNGRVITPNTSSSEVK